MTEKEESVLDETVNGSAVQILVNDSSHDSILDMGKITEIVTPTTEKKKDSLSSSIRMNGATLIPNRKRNRMFNEIGSENNNSIDNEATSTKKNKSEDNLDRTIAFDGFVSFY